jgi:hypothetical protein
MTQFTRRATIVILASDQHQANLDACQFDTGGEGDETFTVGLSPTGAEPATHYWASTVCTEQHWQAFKAQEAQQISLGPARTRWLFDGLTTTPDEVLATMGLKRLETGP